MIDSLRALLKPKTADALIVDRNDQSIVGISGSGDWLKRFTVGQAFELSQIPSKAKVIVWDSVKIYILDEPSEGAAQALASDVSDHTKHLKAMVSKIQLEHYDYLKRIVDTIQDYLFVVSSEGILLQANTSVETLFRVRQGDFLGLKFGEMLSNKDGTEAKFEDFQSETSREVIIHAPDGKKIPALASCSPLLDKNSAAIGFVCVAKDVSEFVALLSQLKTEKIRAEQASFAKSQFLSNISHELRTPLNAIIGYSELLMEDITEGDFSEVPIQLPRIKDSGSYLLELINNILDISKIEAGKSDLQSSKFSFDQLWGELKIITRPLVTASGNSLVLDNQLESGTLTTDKRLLKQILINLLTNAMKFTSQGEVKVTVQNKADGYTQISVADSGRGIAEGDISKIFEKFTQVHDVNEDQLSGSGLGLSIVKTLVDTLNAHIDVTSAIGKGTEFRVTLPPASKHKQEIKAINSQVLVVDDDPDMRQVTADMIDSRVFDVMQANNYTEAVAMFKQNRKIDLLLADIHLPDRNGFELIAWVNEHSSQTKIAVISGSTIADVIAKCHALGMIYMEKPFTLEQLNKLMKKLCLDDVA
ncbi:MAG: response regulator [Pseudobacteriovorax sp.]|nr:response regulator [Pseudobacteriovorax sp.]